MGEEDLAFAREVIRKRPAGLYIVRELFGEEWESIRRPRHYGRGFKATVLGFILPGVRWVGKKSNNCQLYEVLPESPSRK